MHVPMHQIRIEMNMRHDEKLTISEKEKLNQQREFQLDRYRKQATEQFNPELNQSIMMAQSDNEIRNEIM